MIEAQGYFQPAEKAIDAEWIGDNMENEANKKVTRFLFNNCHGLDYNKKDNNYMKSKIQAYLSTGAHYIALAEIGINIHKGGNIQKVNEIMEEVIGEGMTTFNHGKSISDSDFQWGGVGTILYGRLHQRWLTTEKDRHGRWVMQKFFGERRNLCVYTLYRVNPGNNSKGGSTSAWSQQKYSLDVEKIYEDPRKQVMTAIIQDINKKMKEGNSIILMADLNEGTDSREKSNDKLEQMGLVNVMEHRIDEQIPNTHRNGSRPIDHIWATGDICAHITGAGISPFNYPAYSDHRSLVVDIDMKQILDADYLFLSSFVGRTLKMSMPERVEKYGEEVVSQWDYHKINDKIARIQKLFSKRGPIKSNVRKLNKLDKQITEIMLCAEKKCARIGRKPTVPWSPKIHNAVQKIYKAGYDRRMARNALRRGDAETKLRYDKTKKNYKEAKLEYKALRKESEKLREEFLDKRIKLLQEQRSEFRNKKKIKILKILKHREKQRDQARRINYVLERQKKAGLASLLIPSKETYEDANVDIFHIPTIWKKLKKANGKDVKKWIRITDRITMEKLLVEWQRYHFMQANETPFASEEWEKTLTNKSNQERILSGEFIVHEKYPQECQLMFDCMKKETKVKPDIDCHTSYGDFLSFINKADETTSASPSGRTYSHYKALASEASMILQSIHGIFSLALQHQVVLERWSTTITTLILKDDIPRIHRLRTIHIVEAELQFISKKTYAQRMMKKAENSKILTDEQYGGRTQRQALSVVINKMLYYNITAQKLTKAAFMDDDARACYDRIIPHIAEVETQKWGVQRETAKLTTKILKSQKFHIRTSHGIGKQTYTNHDDEKTHGAGQGLGWSGPLWTCSSDTISKAMNKTCVGMTYKSFDGEVIVNKCGDFFVDDTATGVTENNIRKSKSLLEELGCLEQTHAFLMFSEGHKIAFDKCSFYLADFTREKSGHRLKNMEEYPGDLYLKEGFDQKPKKIKRLNPDEAHRTLGHYLAIDGNCERQSEEIKKKIKNWNKCIVASGLSKESKLMAYNGWLLPSIKYKIISCTMDYKECDEIMKIIQPTLLHSYGIAKTCSRVVLHASRKLAGLNVYHLFQLQGFEKLKLFMWHYRRMDTTGKLLKITMDYTQLELGVSQQFLQLNYSQYQQYITKTWVTSIWSYLEQCKAKIEMIHNRQYIAPREGDRYLMEVLIANKLPKEKLVKINQIRMYLKILTLSDMVEVGSRVKILRRVLDGKASRRSEWEWPRICEIPKAWMEIWRNVITTIITPYLLVRPLGRWKGRTHQVWDGMTDYTGSFLRHNSNQYIKKIGSNKYIQKDSIDQSKEFVYPVDIVVNASSIIEIMSRGRKNKFEERGDRKHTSYLDIVRNLKYWERRNLGNNIPSEHQFEIIEHLLLNGNFLSITDGSYKDGKASHAWCVANKQEQERVVISAGPVDGNKNEVSAFRAEAMGLIAALSIIGIVEKKGIVGREATIQLDCKSLINKIRGTKVDSIRYVEDEDIDVVSEIRFRMHSLQTPLRILHVKGHQDKHCPYENLSFTAKLNCDMDHAAKAFLQNPPSHLTPTGNYPILPAQAMVIKIRNKMIVRDIREQLNDSWIKKRWEKYMSNVLKIKKPDLERINLRALTKYIKEHRTSAASIAKIIHKQINTFVVCKEWKTSSSEICPLCKLAPESYRHVLSCTFPPLQQSRNTSIRHICDALDHVDTHPELKTFLKQAIQSFVVDYPLRAPTLSMNPIDVQLNVIHRSQNRIGWNNFFRGYITVHMEKMQEEYLKEKGDATPFLSAQRWGNSLASLVVTHYRNAWKNRCDALALINDDTMQQRRREMACEKLVQLQQKWWVLLQKDRHLLNQDEYWLKRAPYPNVQMWINQIEAALTRAEHLKEVKGNDIRNYLQRRDPGNNDILEIIPSQIHHRKSKYSGIAKKIKNCKLRFGPTGVTRVAVTNVGKYKQLKLTRDGRTHTARDAHDTGSHVK